MQICEALTRIRQDGRILQPGESLGLSDRDAEYLLVVGAVRLMPPDELTPAPSPSQEKGNLTVDPDSEISGELLETDGIGTGELIGGFVDHVGDSLEQNPDNFEQPDVGTQPKASKRGGKK